jgi:WD40 repeat protein
MPTLSGIGRSFARLRLPPWLALALAFALAGCTRVPEEHAGDPTVPQATAPAEVGATAKAPVPMRAVGATFRLVAEVPEPITPRVAFGPEGTWWHWDGEQATAWIDGKAQPTKLDAVALLAADPRPPVDRPLAIGSTLVTATGTRTLPEPVVFGLRDMQGSWGYADTGATFSRDGTLLLVTQEWHPSRCCRDRDGDGEHEHAPDPPRHMGLLFDTTTGTRTELPGVQTPSVLGRERLVLSGPQDALYSREPFYPLDASLSLGWSALALTLGLDESVIATANRASDGGVRLALHRASDGMPLREWEGPPDAAALAFHPTYPLLAVAGSSRLELWRVDLETPTRLAHTTLSKAPKAIVFHPDGHRLLLTGEHGRLLELLLDEEPIGGEASTPLDLALVRDDPSATPLRAGTDAIALAIDATHVHAYGRSNGLYSFDRASGRRVRSWRRRNDEVSGVTFAERAPIVALPEQLPLHEARPTRRIDIVDARTYATVGTTWISPGELAHLRLSPRGTALAWSIEGDPMVTLQAVTGGTLLRMTANTNDVEAIAISDDDRRMAVANRHITDNVFLGTVDETTPVVITTPGGVSRLAFSQDGTRLYVMGFDGKIHVVDPARGTVVASLDPKITGAGDLVATPEGRHLAIAREGVVVLDVTTGAEVLRVPITTPWVRTVAVAPDGHDLAVGDAEGQLYRFMIP